MSNNYPIEKALATSPLFKQIFDLVRTIRKDEGDFAIILSEDLYWEFKAVVVNILMSPASRITESTMVSPTSILGVNIGRLYDVDGTLGKIIVMPTSNENNSPPEVYLAKSFGLPMTGPALQRLEWNTGFVDTMKADEGKVKTLSEFIDSYKFAPQSEKEKEPQPVTETPPIPIDIRKRRLNLD